MNLKKKVSCRTTGMAVGIFQGLLVSVVVTLVFTAVLAWLVAAEKIEVSAVGYGSMVALLLSAMLGSWVASAKIGCRRVQVCGITGCAYYLTLLSITALFFGGQYQGMGVAAILVLVGSGLPALLGMKQNKPRKAKIKKHAYC